MEEMTPQSDKDIIDEIQRAFLLEEETFTDNVVVTSKNGKVTLTGTVESLEDKQRIEDIVENTPGVILVKNNLKVVRLG